MIQAVELPESFKMSTLQFPRRGAVPGRAGPTEMSLPSISFGAAPLACKVQCPPRVDPDAAPALREVSGSWISLIPANAGTQMKECRFGSSRLPAPPYDLGPGIRRGERIKGAILSSRNLL